MPRVLIYSPQRQEIEAIGEVVAELGLESCVTQDRDAIDQLMRTNKPQILIVDGSAAEWPCTLCGVLDGIFPLVIATVAGARQARAVLDRADAAGQTLDIALNTGDPVLLESRLRIAAARCEEITELQRDRERRADQARMWEVLLEFSRHVADLSNDSELLDAIVRAAAEMTCSTRVSIMVPDESGEFLSVIAAIGFDPAEVRDARIPVGETVAGRVFRSGSRTTTDDLPDQAEDSSDYGCQTFASIPMASTVIDVEHERVGVLNITQRSNDRPFQPWELEFIDLLGGIAGSAMDDLRTRRQREQARESIITALATLAECRDNDTGLHVERVTRFSKVLAEDLRANGSYADEIDDTFLVNLARATPLHDIGKVAIPDAVLLKPGRLTDSEMDIMRTHAARGRDTIRSLIRRSSDGSFLKMAEEITGSHHEWWNGKGYPDQLEGMNIPLAARIVTVADVYDAVTSERVYKKAMTHEVARDIITEYRGIQFDPKLVDAFLRCEEQIRQLARGLRDTPAQSLAERRDVA